VPTADEMIAAEERRMLATWDALPRPQRSIRARAAPGGPPGPLAAAAGRFLAAWKYGAWLADTAIAST
jgi:hypothetical protein